MQKNNGELFTTMPVGKAVAKLAIPTVISQIVVILYSLADTFFVGQIGDPNQLAALSITFPIFTLLTAVANLFGIGANSVIARSLGKDDKDTAKKSFCIWFLGKFCCNCYFGHYSWRADEADFDILQSRRIYIRLFRTISAVGFCDRWHSNSGRFDFGPFGSGRWQNKRSRHRPFPWRNHEYHS